MQFHYIAINQENQKLSGNIHAENTDAARKELNKLGFSVISISEIAETTSSDTSALNRYKFEAIDSSGKKIIGTITSKDAKNAYTRLIHEYHFKVESLADIKTPEILEDLKSLEQSTQSVNLTKKEQIISDANADEKKLSGAQKQLTLKVDEIIKSVNDTLDSHQNYFTIDAKKKMKDAINKLITIKSSYNFEYIKTLSSDLLRELTKKENYILGNENDEKIQNRISLEAEQMILLINNFNANDNSANTFSESINNLIDKKSTSDKPQNLNLDSKYHELNENFLRIKSDIILYIKSSKENKEILKNEIKDLFVKRKKIKSELKLIKNSSTKQIEGNRINNSETEEIKPKKDIFIEIYYFSGWLLIFYLIYYLIIYYLNTKEISFISEQSTINPYKPSLIRNLTLFLFFIHCFMSIQKNCFKSGKKQLWISMCLSIAFTVFIISNF